MGGGRLDTPRHLPTESHAMLYPVNRYASYQAATRSSLDVARGGRPLLSGQTVITQVTPVTARYYNPVAPDQYDIVLNLPLTEPTIEYSYSLTVQHVPRPPRTRAKNYYPLNSAGEVKPVPLD